MPRTRKARLTDIDEIATSLPEVTHEGDARRSYAMRGKGFVSAREPRKDAVDENTGERLTDVLVFRVADAHDKEAVLQSSGPWFTTPHFDGYNAVLLQESRIGEMTRAELAEVITDAWIAVSPQRVAARWLADRGGGRP